MTNYHVLTARTPSNPAMLEPGYPDSPDEIYWSVFTRPDFIIRGGSFSIDAGTHWLEHKNRASGVDIAAISLSFPEDAVILTQSDLSIDEKIDIQIGMEVFIVGYPYGFSIHNILPIWKRGTIASEPTARPDGLDKFYVDAFAHPGMSGSPVFAVSRRQMFNFSSDAAEVFAAYERGETSAADLVAALDPKEFEQGAFENISLTLIDIYGGRVRLEGNRDANLGVVYGSSCLEEIFSSPVVVARPFPPE